MTTPPVCPRCGHAVTAPGLFDSGWQCHHHGRVEPYHACPGASPTLVAQVAAHAQVPLWAPRPTQRHGGADWATGGFAGGWLAHALLTGVGWCGDAKSGARATVTAFTGPAPLGGPADLLVVAEAPGIGLGAHLAGLSQPDPGDLVGEPTAAIDVEGHHVPLWHVPTPSGDGCAYAGEAEGDWVWVLAWPESAGLLLVEPLALTDLRRDHSGSWQTGAPSTHLAA